MTQTRNNMNLAEIEKLPYRYVYAEGPSASWAGNLRLEAIRNKHKSRRLKSIFSIVRPATLHEVISCRGGLLYGWKCKRCS